MNLVELRELPALNFSQCVIICLILRMDMHRLSFDCDFSRGLDGQSPRYEDIKFYCMPKALIIRAELD